MTEDSESPKTGKKSLSADARALPIAYRGILGTNWIEEISASLDRIDVSIAHPGERRDMLKSEILNIKRIRERVSGIIRELEGKPKVNADPRENPVR